MKFLISGNSFIEYSWNAFGALILWWVPVVLFFGWGGLIMFMMGEFTLGFYEIGIVLFPIPLMFLAYLADRVVKSTFLRWLIIYCFWFIIAFIICFVFISALGGMSMAAVENPNLWPQRLNSYKSASLKGTLFAQPLILAVSFFGLYRLRKKTKIE